MLESITNQLNETEKRVSEMQANKTLYSDTNKENINTTMTATAEVKTMNLRIHEQKKELR